MRHQMIDSDFDGVQDILYTMGKRDDFKIIYVLDTDGRVVFAPDNRDIGLRLDNREPDCQPCHSLPAEERPGSVVTEDANGQSVFRSMNPIENSSECVDCHDPDQRILGVLLTDISTEPLEAPLAAHLRENIFWWIAAIGAAIIVVNWAVSHFVLNRLERLANAMTGFGKGEPLVPVTDGSPDEIGQLTGAFNTMAHKVETRRQENEALSERLRDQSVKRGELLKRLITAQEDERRRVARELHDELGQVLTGLALRTEALEKLVLLDSDLALEQLRQMRGLVGEASEGIYDLILALRPSVLDDLGLVPALKTHLERVTKSSGIQYDLDAKGLERRLPASVETALFRTSQEAIANVIRHAAADRVRIRLACDDQWLNVEIVDDGRGFDLTRVNVNGNSARGLGLLGMKERIVQCGGDLEISSRPGTGTIVCMRVPIEEMDCA